MANVTKLCNTAETNVAQLYLSYCCVFLSPCLLLWMDIWHSWTDIHELKRIFLIIICDVREVLPYQIGWIFRVYKVYIDDTLNLHQTILDHELPIHPNCKILDKDWMVHLQRCWLSKAKWMICTNPAVVWRHSVELVTWSKILSTEWRR